MVIFKIHGADASQLKKGLLRDVLSSSSSFNMSNARVVSVTFETSVSQAMYSKESIEDRVVCEGRLMSVLSNTISLLQERHAECLLIDPAGVCTRYSREGSIERVQHAFLIHDLMEQLNSFTVCELGCCQAIRHESVGFRCITALLLVSFTDGDVDAVHTLRDACDLLRVSEPDVECVV